jgi:glycolate oxidase iron-sulfur subunit
MIPDSIQLELDKCARCGKCRAQCPVFFETKNESSVARGRIALLDAYLKGDIRFSRKVKESMMTCLRCLRCLENCPSGVRIDELLNFAREKMAQEIGVPLPGKIIFRVILRRRKLFNFVIRAAKIFQRLLPRDGSAPPLRHLPLFFGGKRRVPPLAARSVLASMPEVNPAEGAEKKRVALFVGCLINYTYPDIARATVDLLRRGGATVVIPRKQLCCGQPVLGFGDVNAAKWLARRNVKIFNEAGCDAVVTACASCGRMLKKEYAALLGEGEAFRPRVYDVCEFLDAEKTLKFERVDESVTYHDPCHLNWGQGISEEPRRLIRASAKLVEMADAVRCCGGGGTFSLFHYDISSRIASHKVRSIRECAAGTVLTDCPGCILQIEDRLAAEGVEKRVEHLVEFLAGKRMKDEG